MHTFNQMIAIVIHLQPLHGWSEFFAAAGLVIAIAASLAIVRSR